MKVIILTESQVERLISEQILLPGIFRGSEVQKVATSAAAKYLNLDPHTRNSILAIAAAFIPVVGPALSLGITAYDSKKYWDEGKKKEAALSMFLGLLPGISNVAIFKELGVKGMTGLASKIISGSAELTELEAVAIQSLKNNPKLVDAVRGYIKNQAVNKGVDLAQSAVKKGK